MSASKDPYHAHHPRWLEAVQYGLALICVGVVVHFLITLLPHSFLQRIDAVAWDALMRNQAKTELQKMKDPNQSKMEPAVPWNQFVFVDVDDDTCKEWAKRDHSASIPVGCSMSSLTPRARLANVINAISNPEGSQGKPALVVLDIDLAPVTGVSDSDNATLCRSVVELAKQVPVIVVRPTAIDLVRGTIDGHTSIFDPAQTHGCDTGSREQGPDNLWFGSSLVWNDPDQVIRRVGTRDQITIVDGADDQRGNAVVGSVGLLGGALVRRIDQPVLACWFPGSAPPSLHPREPCPNAMDDGPAKQLDAILTSEPPRKRIFFSVPTWGPDRSGRNYPYVHGLLCHIPAYKFPDPSPETPPIPIADEICSRPHALSDAVIMIGGSYIASGDLRTTPLNTDVPGAVIHINAIRAFAEALGSDRSHWVLDESRPLLFEALLIVVAALLGLGVHELARWLARGRGAIGKALIKFIVSVEGIIVQVVVILACTMLHGVRQLPVGYLVEVLTPPLVIAFEGSGNVFYFLHGLFEALIGWVLAWLGRVLFVVRLSRDARAANIQASHLEIRIDVEEDSAR